MRARSRARQRRVAMLAAVLTFGVASAPGASAGAPATPVGSASTAEAGELDTTWSGDGKASFQTRYFPQVNSHPDGRVGVALYKDGRGGAFTLYDLEADGSPAPFWVENREFRGPTSGISFPHQMLPYGGGQIVLGAWNGGGLARMGLARLRQGGAYWSTGSFLGTKTYKVFPREHDHLEVFSAGVYGNSRMMAAVAAFDVNSVGDLIYVGQGVVRINGVGSLDTTLSGDGYLPVAKDVEDIAFRSDGGMYMGRKVGGSHEIRKFLPNGSLDPSFSSDGRALVPCGATHVGADLEVDASGRVLVTCVRYAGSVPDLRMARMTTAGGLDPTYSDNGLASLVLTGGHRSHWVLHVDPDGTMFAASRNSTIEQVFVHSLDSSGDPNLAFSGDGVGDPTLTVGELLSMTRSGNRLIVAVGQQPTSLTLNAVALT